MPAPRERAQGGLRGIEAAVARSQNQGRRINACGTVVAMHSAIDGSPSVPLAWQPSDEGPCPA
ncbi:hypothetical protein [Streptomyces sp. NPDC054874]